MIMEIIEKDKAVITDSYPELNFTINPTRINGQFRFSAAYDEKENTYIKNPDISFYKNLIIIQDAYEIEVEFVKKEDQVCPVVKEIGGRIEKTAKKHGFELTEVHVNPNKTLCVAGPFDNYCNLTLIEYLDRPLLQFLYDQSYFEQYGRWPRGEYSHGLLGLLENYTERVDGGTEGIQKEFFEIFGKTGQLENLKRFLANTKIKGHHPCICQSGLRYRNCHPKVLKAFWHLQDSLKFL